MSELEYQIRGYDEDILVDENDEYITASERIQELEGELLNHIVIKSQCPTNASDFDEVIAQGLGKMIMEQFPTQYTEHGTAGFVEVRILLEDTTHG